MLMRASLEDEEVQKLGIVIVAYCCGTFRGCTDYELGLKALKTTHALSTECVALYILFDDDLWI